MLSALLVGQLNWLTLTSVAEICSNCHVTLDLRCLDLAQWIPTVDLTISDDRRLQAPGRVMWHHTSYVWIISTQIPKLQVFNSYPATHEDMPGLQGRMYPPISSSYDRDVVQDPDLPNRPKFKHSAPRNNCAMQILQPLNHQLMRKSWDNQPAKSWVAGDSVHKRRCHRPKQMVPPVNAMQSSGSTTWSRVANKVFGVQDQATWFRMLKKWRQHHLQIDCVPLHWKLVASGLAAYCSVHMRSPGRSFVSSSVFITHQLRKMS